jgi:hypothetical protein
MPGDRSYIEKPATGKAPDARLQRRGFTGSEVEAARYNLALIAHLEQNRVVDNRSRWDRYDDYSGDPRREAGKSVTYPILLGGVCASKTIEL